MRSRWGRVHGCCSWSTTPTVGSWWSSTISRGPRAIIGSLLGIEFEGVEAGEPGGPVRSSVRWALAGTDRGARRAIEPGQAARLIPAGERSGTPEVSAASALPGSPTTTSSSSCSPSAVLTGLQRMLRGSPPTCGSLAGGRSTASRWERWRLRSVPSATLHPLWVMTAEPARWMTGSVARSEAINEVLKQAKRAFLLVRKKMERGGDAAAAEAWPDRRGAY